MKEANKILHIKGLRASFRSDQGEKEVIHGLDIVLKQGETLGIVGESGSGKSVSSLSIMRLIPSPPVHYGHGEILYKEEHDVIGLDNSEMAALRGSEMAMIFQEPMSSLNPLKKCGFQVLEAILCHQQIPKTKAEAQVIALFEKVKLPDPERAFHSYPHELSGGQKQRVMIAMAISCEPSLLIADEPTTALDVTVQREIIELLKQLQKETRMAMIFISHDLAVVADIADNILVMKDGNMIESGPSHEIMQSPKEAYTRGLLASRPPKEGRPKRLMTVSDHLERRSHMPQEQESHSQRKQRHERLYENAPILEVKGLHTWYPIRAGLLGGARQYVKAVQGINLNLYEGEVLGIVGESGCGKSTLGRTIIGLERPHAGTIRYRGKSDKEMSRAEKRRMRREVQLIFQDPYSSLNPRMRIGPAIQEPMRVHGVAGSHVQHKRKTMELLERVGLQAEHYNRYPHEFSGGQRQRICIARSLALEPKVVICDESVSALDVSVQAQVLNLLNELKEEFSLSYLFISHDLSVVRYMSDKVLVMNQGKTMSYGEADEVYLKSEDPYTRRLIASSYEL